MKTIYIDIESKCHVTSDGTMTEVQTEFFDGKCDAFIEGYCYEANENTTSIYPWMPYETLDNAQRAYEKRLIATYEKSLSVMGVKV